MQLTIQHGYYIDERHVKSPRVQIGPDHQVVALDVEPAALLERRLQVFPHFPPGEVRVTLRRGRDGFDQDPGRGDLRQDLDISGL